MENETHFLFKCPHSCYKKPREDFVDEVKKIVRNFDSLTAEDKTVYLMMQENTSLTEKLAIYIIRMTGCREQQLR